ncbi:hypothetical protein [Tunturibacter empetritectus]|uniref:DUF4398 domain-containing protein n=1 Tax=Tunturiibacter lichenicola TaxID=2051959 RepID=A0A7W8J6F6_9BACT|nr:hypothetical protein [Edaphobacter lichenicola]MBB5343391.1 hypothetical protein [Edaphobacter lichenicola]
MQLRKVILVGSLALGTIGVAVGIAQNPVQNVRPGRHPNLAAAQRLSEEAYQKIVAAQQANEFDMGGHAQKAKDLLDQANRELAQAAGAANRH